MVWSDRCQPCTTTSRNTMLPSATVTLQAPRGATIEAIEHAQPRRTIARALDHQAAPRRASKRYDPLDRAPATTRPAAHPHAWHKPLPHLGSRGVAARAVRLAARPVDQLQQLAPRAPPLSSFSPPFETIRRPTANRGAQFELSGMQEIEPSASSLRPPDHPHARLLARRDPMYAIPNACIAIYARYRWCALPGEDVPDDMVRRRRSRRSLASHRRATGSARCPSAAEYRASDHRR